MDPIDEQKSIRISALLLKQMQGALSTDERIFLDSWLNESESHQDIYNRCLDGHMQREAYSQLHHFDTRRDFGRISKKIFDAPVKKKAIVLKRIWPYAAAASILLAITGLWYWNDDKNQQADVHIISSIDRLPASSQAVVTFSDGRSYQLDQDEKKVVLDGQGIHYADGDRVAAINSAISAKIETPRGGTYDILLPDGTAVKLNAGTVLTYPTVFAKDKREVNLSGEAYFEVAKRKNQPFIVKTENQQVAVLGTHFNVYAYPASPETKTTLLEGKVLVKEMGKGNQVVLLPGEQSVASLSHVSKHSVNVQQEMAWVYGKFNFDGKSLQEVMDELSRWYAIDVQYQGEIPDVAFFGGTYRTSKLSTILKILKDQDLSYRLTTDGKLILSKSDPKGQKGGQ